MLSGPIRSKNVNSHTRKVLIEFNKNLNIQSYQTWRKKYAGEIIRNFGYPINRVKNPTMKHNGFKFAYDRVWGEVSKWSNKDIVTYVMSKHHIDKKSEVVYVIQNEKNYNGTINAKHIQLFYKNAVTNQ